jgi:hypothetical protein
LELIYCFKVAFFSEKYFWGVRLAALVERGILWKTPKVGRYKKYTFPKEGKNSDVN